MKRRGNWEVALVAVSLLGILAACEAELGLTGRVAGPSKVAASPTPTATPSPSPTPSASPTPNPCDVYQTNASAPAFVALGETFVLDVTPVGPAGPQEGVLDYCNTGGNGQRPRSVVIESATAGVHCIASCSGFTQTWKADAKGEAQIRVSVERVISAPVTVTVR